MGKLVKTGVISVRFVCYLLIPVFFMVGRGWDTFTNDNLCPTFRQKREGKRMLSLLVLNCLQLKIIW